MWTLCAVDRRERPTKYDPFSCISVSIHCVMVGCRVEESRINDPNTKAKTKLTSSLFPLFACAFLVREGE